MPILYQTLLPLCLWLAFVAIPFYQRITSLPEELQNDELAFGFLTMGALILACPWVQVSVFAVTLTSILQTRAFLATPIQSLNWIPPVRKINDTCEILRTSVLADYETCQTIQEGFKWGNMSKYLKAQSGAYSFTQRVILGLFIQSSRLAIVIAVSIAFMKSLFQIQTQGALNIPISMLGQAGVSVGLNFLFGLTCTFMCLELRGATMLAGDKPSESVIERAQDEMHAFVQKDEQAFKIGRILLRVVPLCFLMVVGIFTHLLWTFLGIRPA